MKEKENRTKPVYVALTEKEYAIFKANYEKTIYRSLSQYGARLLLGKPVKVITRNRSVDDLIEFGVQLRKDLRKLLTKDAFDPSDKEALEKKIRSIETELIQLVAVCSRK